MKIIEIIEHYEKFQNLKNDVDSFPNIEGLVSLQTLVDRLKQIVERKEQKIEKEIAELAEEQMEIQALIDAKARNQREHQQPPEFSEEDTEALPIPAAIYHSGPLHSGKRTSCKFAKFNYFFCLKKY